MTEKILIGVSSCLLGNPVRYDGGHKHDRYITDILGQYFEFLPVCPEVECGLPVPRETMRLVGNPEQPRLLTTRTGVDLTEQMQKFCGTKIMELETAELCGFIFKKDSPSSGLFRVNLPLEEEGRLNDANLRENFIERVFCYHRWKKFVANQATYKELIKFHARHKLQLMAHNPKLLSAMGKLVASGKTVPPAELMDNYCQLLMTALTYRATVKKNVNVLYHLIGYFKKLNNTDEQAELVELIERYARHIVPLVVPLTLINHYVRKYKIMYLIGQTYLEPHPAELMLRNHV